MASKADCNVKEQVTACGNQGRPIFADDRDRQLWLETLEEVCGKTGWRIHAFVSWVADRLEMGHPGRVSQAVTRMRIRPGRRLRQFQRVLYRLEK